MYSRGLRKTAISLVWERLDSPLYHLPSSTLVYTKEEVIIKGWGLSKEVVTLVFCTNRSCCAAPALAAATLGCTPAWTLCSLPGSRPASSGCIVIVADTPFLLINCTELNGVCSVANAN